MSQRPPIRRRATSSTQPLTSSKAAPAAAPRAPAQAALKSPNKLKKDEFSTGRARALRAKTLGTTPGPAAVGAEPEASVGVTASAATAAVTGTGGGPVSRKPVLSFDTATYLTIVGNPPTHRITQQQADTLRRMGIEHGVIGMPKPTSPTYLEELAALKQELQLLNANGIRTDTYYYFSFNQGSTPKTDAAVRDELFKVLDGMKGQPAPTFWLDVEFDPKLNPCPGVAHGQRLVDAAYRAFNEWKQANPDSKLEFGLYTGESMWNQLVSGPKDPFNTKYAELGVPLWEARYPKGYALADASKGLEEMRKNLPGFGGWSVDKGNVRAWQYADGEAKGGYLPTFTHELDRNVWLQDASLPPLPITAIPSGFRADLPVKNQALADLLAADRNKPADQRQFKTLQDLINVNGKNGVSLAKLGVKENDCYQFRWEDPWKLVHGVPLGVDQFSSQPLPPAAPTSTPVPATPPTTPAPSAPVAPPIAGSPLDLLGLQRGATDGPRVRQLQDTLMALGHLANITGNAGYGVSLGPLTESALKAFQQAQHVPASGVVDRATVVALAKATNSSLGFDAQSPFAAAFGLARNANAAGDRPGIKALQDALIAGGYVPASMTSQTGYGTNFGPITEAGLKAFQRDNGLTDSGVVDAATLAALANPRPRPAGFAAGVASTHRAELGLPKGPAYTTAEGSLRQDFDRGSVWVTADRVLHAEAQSPAGLRALVPPRKLGTAQSLEEARASFLSQWGPTAYNDPPVGSDVPYGYSDCGPTSALMALSALGIVSRPGAAEAYTAIDHQRDLTFGYDTSTSVGLALLPATKGTVGYGLQAAGATVTGLRNTVAEVDAALGRGNPVIIGSSSTWTAWGKAERTAGNYLNGGDPGGHFVTVLGRAVNGNYLVGDPLLKGGPIEVTQAQLEAALKGAWNSSNSLAEVSRPG